MSNTREEHIKLFKERMCSICRSKFCKHEIHVTRDKEVTSIKCHEYNKRFRNQYK